MGFNKGAINLAFISYTVAYVISVISCLLKGCIKNIYDSVIKGSCVLYVLIATYLIKIYGTAMIDEFVSIIYGTNYEEFKEFIATYFVKNSTLILIVIIIFFIVCLDFILKRIKINRNNTRICIVVFILLFSFFLTMRRSVYLCELFPGNIMKVINYDVKELVLTNPEIEYIEEVFPENVIIIIGESFSKSHSSLYGYEKETNPKLRGLQEDSLLTVYSKVSSPATHTIDCFKCIMSSYKPEYGNKVAWNECATLPEVLNSSGYTTNWVSSQSKYGVHDNIVTKYANLCSKSEFVGDKYLGGSKKDYDEGVIEVAKPLINSGPKNVYFFHLIGSHFSFKMRYPSHFSKFKENDYVHKPKNQRKWLAEYDNSILYNDSVVSEIINLFIDKDAVVLYFSDHAIDVFESTNDYVGHAIPNSDKSRKIASAIPFMIYTSPEFVRKFPKKVEMIRQSVNNEYRTDDLMYTVMDLIGIRIKGETLKGKSLFQLE